MAKWKTERVRLLREIASALQLEEDMILNEIESAESKEEAIGRVDAILADAETALAILKGE